MVTDDWFDWLLHHRHGSDPELQRQILAEIEQIAERVLDGAALEPSMTLLDVGTGDGLIAFQAIDRIGPTLRVLMADISDDLLAHDKKVAAERGVSSQCTFLAVSAEKLTDVADDSLDAVTTRSVLAYVHDKDAAFREFFRVLKPGGRLSIAEPLFREDALEAYVLRTLVEKGADDAGSQSARLLHRLKSAQFPDTPDAIAQSPHTNYSERDLLGLVQRCGFNRIHLEMHIDVKPMGVMKWSAFLKMSPHPWAPPLEQILNDRLTSEERRRYEEGVRPLVETGQLMSTDRMVYVTAEKPTARTSGIHL